MDSGFVARDCHASEGGRFGLSLRSSTCWMPAFAGMTVEWYDSQPYFAASASGTRLPMLS